LLDSDGSSDSGVRSRKCNPRCGAARRNEARQVVPE